MRSQPPPNSTLGKLWEIDTSTLRRQKLARDKADCYADEFLALTPVVERVLDELTASPLTASLASRFVSRIVP